MKFTLRDIVTISLATAIPVSAFVKPGALKSSNAVVLDNSFETLARTAPLNGRSKYSDPPTLEEIVGTKKNYGELYGHLKDTPVRTVSECVSEFYKLYGKPIIFQYRSIVNELLQRTHLYMIDPRFEKGDKVFSLGFVHAYDTLMKGLPVEEDKVRIYDSMCKALTLDGDQMRKDAEELKEWVKGKSEDDVLAAMKGEVPTVSATESFEKVRSNELFLYTFQYGVGVLTLMEMAGAELTENNCDTWSEALVNVDDILFIKDYYTYTKAIEKIVAAEQLLKELEIREKKKMAERLEKKAEQARKAAEKAKETEAALKEAAETPINSDA